MITYTVYIRGYGAVEAEADNPDLEWETPLASFDDPKAAYAYANEMFKSHQGYYTFPVKKEEVIP